MEKSFKNRYYIKNLYLSAGKIIYDHLFCKYRHSVKQKELFSFMDAVSGVEQYIPLYDVYGGRCQAVFDYFIKLYKNTEPVFIVLDDLSGCQRIQAVCFGNSEKFIYKDNNGINLDPFYYRVDSDTFLRELASEYFSIAGEY